MARKKNTGPKSAKKPKPPAAPSLSIFGSPEDIAPTSDDEKKLQVYTTDFFTDLFEDEDFQVFFLDDQTFVAGQDDGIKLMVEVDEHLPFVTFKFPYKPKKGMTKPKILQWINERMLEFPMLRIVSAAPGIVMSTFDYAYDTELDFDVDHFMLQASVFWGLNLTLIESYGEEFLDNAWKPYHGD
jgi:hypothetical protein